MKIDFATFGNIYLEAEDGRDEAWLEELLNNIDDDYRGILSHFFVFEDDNGEEIDMEESKDNRVGNPVKLHFTPFGEYASPYDFKKIKEAYDKIKPRLKEWCIRHKKDSKSTRKEVVQEWNKMFPEDKI